jgi:hypothetical protein
MIQWSAYPDIFGYTQPRFGLPQTSIGTGLVIHTEHHGQKLARVSPKPRSGSETLTMSDLMQSKNVATLKVRLAGHLGSAFCLRTGPLKAHLYRSP